jgi:hypothetical protein
LILTAKRRQKTPKNTASFASGAIRSDVIPLNNRSRSLTRSRSLFPGGSEKENENDCGGIDITLGCALSRPFAILAVETKKHPPRLILEPPERKSMKGGGWILFLLYFIFCRMVAEGRVWEKE